MARKEITLGLFGFGCVGFGLWEVLQQTPGLKTRVKRICVKDPNKARPIDASYFTFNADDILFDEEINVVVELIDDSEAAFSLVKTALSQGKAVVSANKKMIAEHFDELLALQRLHGVPLLYEASCCASIPIIRNLEEYYDNDLLESIEGIVNGSTNYILTRSHTDQLTYSEALKLAQEKGFAETDPRLDTEGFDAKFKLLILLAHAFGLQVHPDEIVQLGIQRLGELELNYAKEKGWKIKLTAKAYKTTDGKISAYVCPKFISTSNKLYTVDEEYNGIVAQTSFAQTQFFVGKGAGGHPTASAVLSDISALSYDYKYEYKKLQQSASEALTHQTEEQIFLRFPPELQSHLLPHFERITEQYLNADWGYFIGDMKLAALQTLTRQHDDISVVMMEA